MSTGKRMRTRRKELGLSAEMIAAELKVSPATVYRYENGEIDKVPGDLLAPISKVLQTTPAYLMGWEDQADSKIPPGFMPLPKMVKVPLLGNIACGEPILARENIEDYIDAPAGRSIDFCLECCGDSMIDAGISDGDIAYIRKQVMVENGQIAAVRIDDVATLKRVYLYPNKIVLSPDNSAYEPLVYVADEMNDVAIEGKLVGFLHWM